MEYLELKKISKTRLEKESKLIGNKKNERNYQIYKTIRGNNEFCFNFHTRLCLFGINK